MAKALEPLIRPTKGIYDKAVALVEDVCSRHATKKEASWLLTWMLDLAGNERSRSYDSLILVVAFAPYD